LTSITQTTNGVVSLVGSGVRYIPFTNFNGGDRFSYVAIDENGISATGAVSILVTPVNDQPLATNLSFAIAGDISGFIIGLQGSDVDGDLLTFHALTLPSKGVLNTSNWIYRPAHGFVGTDSFTFQADDGHTNSPAATATLVIIRPADVDGDGIPDYWETLHDINNRNDDRDFDGLTNYQEYLANTDPRNSSSVLRLLSLGRNAGGQVVLTWASTGGTRYRVQSSDGEPSNFRDIPQPASAEIAPGVLGVPSLINFTDPNMPSTTSNRFYRVRIVTQQ
jgi:hypothetical protein